MLRVLYGTLFSLFFICSAISFASSTFSGARYTQNYKDDGQYDFKEYYIQYFNHKFENHSCSAVEEEIGKIFDLIPANPLFTGISTWICNPNGPNTSTAGIDFSFFT